MESPLVLCVPAGLLGLLLWGSNEMDVLCKQCRWQLLPAALAGGWAIWVVLPNFELDSDKWRILLFLPLL